MLSVDREGCFLMTLIVALCSIFFLCTLACCYADGANKAHRLEQAGIEASWIEALFYEDHELPPLEWMP
jgi:hypothetical protein